MTIKNGLRKKLEEKKDASILIVEDDEAILSMYSISLSRKFTNILTAKDGQEGWNTFQQEIEHGREIPIVITDVIMPNMDGMELVYKIHKIRPATQILIISGFVVNTLSMTSIKEYVAFLPKPLDISVMGMAVSQAYRNYPQAVWLERLKAEIADDNFDTEKIMSIIKEAPWLKK